MVDNGREYKGPFESYCKLHSIRLEKNVPKTPYQNGVAFDLKRMYLKLLSKMV